MMENTTDKSKKAYFLQIIILLFTSVITTLLSLSLAFWTGQHAIFRSYFDRPVVLLLNYLPVLLLQLFLLGITGKQWLSFLLSSLLVFGGVTGNFFKMTYRRSPFVWADVSYIKTALGVSSNYSISFNSRMWIFVLYIAAASALLFIIRRKTDVRRLPARMILIAVSAASAVLLWNTVYSSEKIYNSSEVCSDDGCMGINGEIREYITKGFTYPFIYSIKEYYDIIPESYNREDAKQLLSRFSDSAIEDEKKVNIVVFQLESFADLTQAGINNISEDTYSFYDELREQAFHGELVVSVFGGGTIETEHSVLTGDCDYFLAQRPQPSFVRYLAENGYVTVGGHPADSYYNRDTINPYLGFEEYRFAENDIYDGKDLNELKPSSWHSDCVFFPSVLKRYRELSSEGKNVFSFNVTMQGHGLYESGGLQYEKLYSGNDYSETTSNSLNNYLGSMKDTQKYMRDFLAELEDDEYPCVVVFYGDHKGDFTNGNHEELKNMDPDTADGHYRMYSTEYVFWANEAAKRVVKDDFSGEGPTISANYLLPLLFSRLGWGGDAYSKYLLEMSETLPVITSNGFYIENGAPVFELSEEGADALNRYKCVEYYLRCDQTAE